MRQGAAKVTVPMYTTRPAPGKLMTHGLSLLRQQTPTTGVSSSPKSPETSDSLLKLNI